MTMLLEAAGTAADQLARGLQQLQLAPAGDLRSRLLRYIGLLDKWNRTYNLTAVRDLDSIVKLHILDCLAVQSHLQGRTFLDVGSGAGLPGIPLALARPEAHVVLVDSSHKKTAFLRQVLAELQMTNVQVECVRVETWRPDEFFDCIVSRAYSDLGEFVTSTSHALSPAGTFAAMKGIYPFEEIEKLPPGFRVSDVIRIQVPLLEAQRHLVLLGRA